MIVNAYSFFDNKVGIFHPPFFFLHRGQAMRAALELAQDMNTSMGRHPNDFALYEVGVFNDQTGALESVPPVNLGVLATFLAQNPNPARSLPFPHNTETDGFVPDNSVPPTPVVNGHG